ncbi:hypothetical protein Tco_1326909 [Tanacetum coccineum]
MSLCFGKSFTMMLLKHQDVIYEFCSSSWWEKLSKETGSEILPGGDGSQSVECTSVLHQTDGVRSKRHHIVPFEEIVTPSPRTVNPKLHQNLVEFHSCHVSSQIEPKSRDFPPNASEMLRYQKETINIYGVIGEDMLKDTVLTTYTPYPSRKIRRICACTSQETTKN